MQPVTLYTQPDCLPCKRVAKKLTEANIRFELVDLSKDRVAADYVKKALRASTVPIIEAEGWLPIVGYRPDELKLLIQELLLNPDNIHDYVYEGEE